MAALREYVASTTPGKTWSLSVDKHFDRKNYFTAIEGKLSDVGSNMQSFTTEHGGATSSRYYKIELTVKRLTDKVKADAMEQYKNKMRELELIA